MKFTSAQNSQLEMAGKYLISLARSGRELTSSDAHNLCQIGQAFAITASIIGTTLAEGLAEPPNAE